MAERILGPRSNPTERHELAVRSCSQLPDTSTNIHPELAYYLRLRLRIPLYQTHQITLGLRLKCRQATTAFVWDPMEELEKLGI
jgi:hypothetical protein